MKIKQIFTIALLTLCSHIDASILVTGPGTNPNTFAQAVTAKVFDHATGTLFLGLASGAGSNALSKVSRITTNNTQPAFISIGTDFSGNEIKHLALSTSIGNQNPNLAVVDNNNETKVVIANESGMAIESNTLNDAAENATAGIVGIAASEQFIFAAIKKNGSTFGIEDGGIAVVEITSATTPLALEERDAQVGGGGNKAQKFDNVVANTPINIGADTTIVVDTVAMHWDMDLERLFVGVQIETGATAGDGAQSIGVAQVDSTGKLTIEAIVPFGAFVNGQVTNIIGARSSGAALDISAIHVRTLHASTGPTYLIVNGGNGEADATNNMIFALPLVDDEDTPAAHGTLARFDSALVGGVFVTQATANAHLLTNASVQANVGTGPLPIAATTRIADIVVVEDTVYVSIAGIPDNDNDAGVFYSQAQFDNTGKIARWTPWTKRAFPYGAISDNNLGRISFFDVDAVTGKLWVVDGDTKQKVHLSDWQTDDGDGSLVTELNKHLSQGCFSMLDLDQSTHSFDTNTTHRFALFGGLGKVIFARTSEALANTPVTSPQIVTTDFSLPENFKVTTLPSSAARVRSLEYSRQTTNDFNYFFAGTDDGLFVFSQFEDVGVNPDLKDLADITGFFITGDWSKITTIPGAIFKVKTIGNNLYVLAFETSSAIPLKGKLYLIPFATTVSAMFAANNIKLIAETNTTPTFATTDWFFDFEIVANNNDASEEQIILATNIGLYKTTRAAGIQQLDSTQANAEWALIDTTDPALFLGIRGISNAAKGDPDPTGTAGASPPCTVWPFSIRDNLGFLTCERGEIHQIGNNLGTCDFVPTPFNSIIATTDKAFKTLDQIEHFWTDGARRFFIIKRILDSPGRNRLYSLPFDVVNWSIESTVQHLVLDPPFDDTPFINWIEQIGATGILMAGTSNGVIALQ